MSDDEDQSEVSDVSPVSDTTVLDDTVFDDIVEEIRRKELATASNWGGSLLLVGSILLFAVLGRTQFDAVTLAQLVVILLAHELGHYLCMRQFNYRNLKMFFIPLFGAAVSGRSHNVPGWKKAIVSLAGPVPSILLGAVIGMIGLNANMQWLTSFAILMIIVNGFNLLPALPLDGRWVLHSIIFNRNVYLDFGFRVAAVSVLGLIAYALGEPILGFLAMYMFIGLGASLQMSKLLATLRSESDIDLQAYQDALIPEPTAIRIAAEVNRRFPLSSTKTKAALALQVFDRLNTKPPGVVATLAILIAYIGSIAVGVVALVFLFHAR